MLCVGRRVQAPLVDFGLARSIDQGLNGPAVSRAETKTMNWYCAHIVMFVELKNTSQMRSPVWEKVVLIEANNEDEAFDKAERHGRSEEGDDGGTFEWEKSPASWVFAGVRKLTECDAVSGNSESGTELTYTEFELLSREDVKRLALGKPVRALFNDVFRRSDAKSNKVEGVAKTAKRKRA